MTGMVIGQGLIRQMANGQLVPTVNRAVHGEMTPLAERLAEEVKKRIA